MTIELTPDQIRVLILMCTLNQPVEISEDAIAELPAIRATLAAALKADPHA
jgi:hypothetical protein